MKVLILKSEDGYEALYIDGKLIDEGEELGEGESQLYMLKQSEKYGFKYADVKTKYLTKKDDEYTSEVGSFPSIIEELNGKY